MLVGVGSIVLGAIIITAAGYIRGYSGFGSGMLAVLGLSILFPPSQTVPVILLLEVAASAYLLPGVWRLIDWSSLGWLFLGAAAGTPIGAHALANIPPNVMRAAIAVIVIALVVMFGQGIRFERIFNKPGVITVGLISGVLNGGAAIGGPPVILFFFSSPAGVAVSRASLIGFFFGTDFYAALMCATQGLMKWQTLRLAGVLLPFLVAGLALGSRSFLKADREVFRKRVLQLLVLLSIGALFRSVVGR